MARGKISVFLFPFYPTFAKIKQNYEHILDFIGLEEFDNSGTDLSTPSSTSCTENRKWDVGEELRDVLSTVRFSKYVN